MIERKRVDQCGLCVVLLVSATVACGGDRGQANDTLGVDTVVATDTGAGTGATGGSENAMIALGDSIFKGQTAGGLCFTCHGLDAKGTTLGPNLTDATWINVDGSLESIVDVVKTGVPQPKQHPSPMMPMGGAQLSDQQVRAVAMYVFSLSRS